jgi:hypothetical protein
LGLPSVQHPARDIYFADINADGWKEILIDSSNYGNHEYPMLVIFDHDGHEITRQKKM